MELSPASRAQTVFVKQADNDDEGVSEDAMSKILQELKQTNQLLMKLESNTKDGIKEMKWFNKRNDIVEVYIRVSVVSVGDIDAIKQEFQCEFYLNVTWKEPQLLGKTRTEEVDWEEAWDPAVYFMDVVNYDIYERNQQLKPSSEENEPPSVVQYFHIKGTFKEILEVNTFPFDYQDLTVVLTSNWSIKEIKMAKDPDRDDNIRTWNFTARQEWDLQKHVLTESTQNDPEDVLLQLMLIQLVIVFK
eukprot:gene4594-5197_t